MSRGVKDLRDMICASRLSSRHPNGFVVNGSDDDDEDDDVVVAPPIVTVTRPPSALQSRAAQRPVSRSASRAGQFSRVDGSLNDAVLPYCDARVVSGLLRGSNSEVRRLQTWWATRPDDVALFHEFVATEWTDERRREFGEMQMARLREEIAAAFLVGMEAGKVSDEDLGRIARNVFHEYPDEFAGETGRATLLDMMDGLASGKGERFKHLLSDVRSSAANSEFAQWLLALRSFLLVSFCASVVKFYRSVYRERREECRRRKRERREMQLRRQEEKEKERQYKRSRRRRSLEEEDDGRGEGPPASGSSSSDIEQDDDRDMIDVSSTSADEDEDNDDGRSTSASGRSSSTAGVASSGPSSASSSGRDSRAAFTVRERPGSVMRSSNPFPDSNRAPIAFSAARLGLVGTLLFLVPQRVPTDARDEQGRSVLSTAIAAKRAACVVLLLGKCRCDVNESIGPAEHTPLHVAATVGDADIAQLLLENGAAANARSHGGNGPTPLHIAVLQGHKAVVSLLMQWGADAHALMNGEEGMSAIELARQAHRYDIAEILEEGDGEDDD